MFVPSRQAACVFFCPSLLHRSPETQIKPRFRPTEEKRTIVLVFADCPGRRFGRFTAFPMGGPDAVATRGGTLAYFGAFLVRRFDPRPAPRVWAANDGTSQSRGRGIILWVSGGGRRARFDKSPSCYFPSGDLTHQDPRPLILSLAGLFQRRALAPTSQTSLLATTKTQTPQEGVELRTPNNPPFPVVHPQGFPAPGKAQRRGKGPSDVGEVRNQGVKTEQAQKKSAEGALAAPHLRTGARWGS